MSGKLIRLVIAAFCIAVPGTIAAQQTRADAMEIATSYSVAAETVYHTAGGRELTLDLYLPQPRDSPVPVLVYYHGGGWVIGSRHEAVLALLPYLEKGFAVANVSYRLAATALAPAAVVDAVCALRWVARNAEEYNLDAERIVVSGHSAGGHLALIVATLPAETPFANECATVSELFSNSVAAARPAAVVNWYGIADVADLLVEPHRQLYAQQWIGGQAQGVEVARSVSPLQHIRRDLPPVITIHGDADPVVPHEHAVRLHDALTEAGAANELVTVPQGSHGGFSLEQDRTHYSRIWQFLKDQGVIR